MSLERKQAMRAPPCLSPVSAVNGQLLDEWDGSDGMTGYSRRTTHCPRPQERQRCLAGCDCRYLNRSCLPVRQPIFILEYDSVF